LVFNTFRMAVIAHGVTGRIIRGTAASAHTRVDVFRTLAHLAREMTETEPI
jgi:hypothetical protein